MKKFVHSTEEYPALHDEYLTNIREVKSFIRRLKYCIRTTENMKNDRAFPLLMTSFYVTRDGNLWTVILKYENRQQWEKEDDDNVWAMQLFENDIHGLLGAIYMPLPKSKAEHLFFRLCTTEATQLSDTCNNPDALLAAQVESLYLDCIQEDRRGNVYIPGKEGFVVGKRDRTDLSLIGRIITREVRYDTMIPGEDAPEEICMELKRLSTEKNAIWAGPSMKCRCADIENWGYPSDDLPENMEDDLLYSTAEKFMHTANVVEESVYRTEKQTAYVLPSGESLDDILMIEHWREQFHELLKQMDGLIRTALEKDRWIAAIYASWDYRPLDTAPDLNSTDYHRLREELRAWKEYAADVQELAILVKQTQENKMLINQIPSPP